MFLAEGAGGVAAMSHRVFGAPLIIYNSLISLSGACPHRAISFIPGELEPIKSDIDLHGVTDSINTGGDITRKSIMMIQHWVTTVRNWP